MKNLKFSFLILFFGVCQAAFLDYFRVFNVKPDLLLISVVIVSLILKLRWAVILSLFAGILKDVLVSSPCANAFFFPFGCFFIIQLSNKISFEELPVRIGLVFILAIVYNICCAAALIYSGRLIPFGIALRIIILGPIYTTIVFSLVSKIYRICPCPPRRC